MTIYKNKKRKNSCHGPAWAVRYPAVAALAADLSHITHVSSILAIKSFTTIMYNL
jgi:hypothetical protein